MGCVMSRSADLLDTVPPTRYSSDSGHCEMRYSTSSSSMQYIPHTTSSTTLSTSLSGSTIMKPEKVYAHSYESYAPLVILPAHGPTYHRFQHNEHRKKQRVVVVEEKEVKASGTATTTTESSALPTVGAAEGVFSMKGYPMPPPPTALIAKMKQEGKGKKQKNKKKTKKNGGKRRASVASEVKFEISWPTSCHHTPGVVPNAIAMGYPYPYPFPLASVPSDPDLVSSATTNGSSTMASTSASSTAPSTPAKEKGPTAGGYFGYEYETTLGIAGTQPEVGMMMEIKPGRNGKWDDLGGAKGSGVVGVGSGVVGIGGMGIVEEIEASAIAVAR